MKRKIFSGVTVALWLAFSYPAFAQNTVRVWAEFDTVGLIGDALRLTLNCESDHPENVTFPILQDNLSADLQIIPEDSLRRQVSFDEATRLHTNSITYLFSAYTEGQYRLPAFRFEYLENDSIVALTTDTGTVRFFAPIVDTTQNIKDIRSVFEVSGKELWKEYFHRYSFLLWIIPGLAVVVLGIWYILKMRKKEHPLFVPQKAPVPPVDTALSALGRLKEKQLWQQNRIKEYYTELTDILRTYLAEEKHIPAIEMTNEELRAALPNVLPPGAGLTDLIATLDTALLVKFAKVQPLPADHETCFAHVQRFLEQEKRSQKVESPDAAAGKTDSVETPALDTVSHSTRNDKKPEMEEKEEKEASDSK